MKVDNLVIIEEIPIDVNQLYFTKLTRKWCQLPYPGHPKGCPNYNKNPNCPPNSPYYKHKITKYQDLKLIIAHFDSLTYKNGMKELHPEWSELQLMNVWFYQSQIQKLLRLRAEKLKPSIILGNGSYCAMEAVGINVIRVLIDLGIDVEVKPKTKTKIVWLVGFKKGMLSNFIIKKN